MADPRLQPGNGQENQARARAFTQARGRKTAKALVIGHDSQEIGDEDSSFKVEFIRRTGSKSDPKQSRLIIAQSEKIWYDPNDITSLPNSYEGLEGWTELGVSATELTATAIIGIKYGATTFLVGLAAGGAIAFILVPAAIYATSEIADSMLDDSAVKIKEVKDENGEIIGEMVTQTLDGDDYNTSEAILYLKSDVSGRPLKFKFQALYGEDEIFVKEEQEALMFDSEEIADLNRRTEERLLQNIIDRVENYCIVEDLEFKTKTARTYDASGKPISIEIPVIPEGFGAELVNIQLAVINDSGFMERPKITGLHASDPIYHQLVARDLAAMVEKSNSKTRKHLLEFMSNSVYASASDTSTPAVLNDIHGPKLNEEINKIYQDLLRRLRDSDRNGFRNRFADSREHALLNAACIDSTTLNKANIEVTGFVFQQLSQAVANYHQADTQSLDIHAESPYFIGNQMHPISRPMLMAWLAKQPEISKELELDINSEEFEQENDRGEIVNVYKLNMDIDSAEKLLEHIAKIRKESIEMVYKQIYEYRNPSVLSDVEAIDMVTQTMHTMGFDTSPLEERFSLDKFEDIIWQDQELHRSHRVNAFNQLLESLEPEHEYLTRFKQELVPAFYDALPMDGEHAEENRVSRLLINFLAREATSKNPQVLDLFALESHHQISRETELVESFYQEYFTGSKAKRAKQLFGLDEKASSYLAKANIAKVLKDTFSKIEAAGAAYPFNYQIIDLMKNPQTTRVVTQGFEIDKLYDPSRRRSVASAYKQVATETCSDIDEKLHSALEQAGIFVPASESRNMLSRVANNGLEYETSLQNLRRIQGWEDQKRSESSSVFPLSINKQPSLFNIDTRPRPNISADQLRRSILAQDWEKPEIPSINQIGDSLQLPISQGITLDPTRVRSQHWFRSVARTQRSSLRYLEELSRRESKPISSDALIAEMGRRSQALERTLIEAKTKAERTELLTDLARLIERHSKQTQFGDSYLANSPQYLGSNFSASSAKNLVALSPGLDFTGIEYPVLRINHKDELEIDINTAKYLYNALIQVETSLETDNGYKLDFEFPQLKPFDAEESEQFSQWISASYSNEEISQLKELFTDYRKAIAEDNTRARLLLTQLEKFILANKANLKLFGLESIDELSINSDLVNSIYSSKFRGSESRDNLELFGLRINKANNVKAKLVSELRDLFQKLRSQGKESLFNRGIQGTLDKKHSDSFGPSLVFSN